MAIPFLSDAKFSRLHKLKFHSTGEITTTGASGTNFDISAIGSNTDLRFLADNDDGSSSVYFLLDASMADYTTPDYYTRFPDNSHLVFGNSANTTALDFEIYHQGTTAYLQGDSLIYIASEDLIQLNADNGVELRHNNSRKLYTGTTGVNVTGTVSTSSHGTSANWKQAYDNYITGVAVTGTSTKTITLTQRDGGTITTTFTDQSGSGGIDMTNGSNNRVVTAVDSDTVNGEAGLLFGGSYLEITPGDIATPLHVKRTSASTRQVNLLLHANDGSSTSEGFLGCDSSSNLRWGGSGNTSLNSLVLTEDNLDFVVNGSTNQAIVRLAGGGTNFTSFTIGGASGAITVNQALGSITIGHHDTSSASSVDNSGNTVIQDVTLDTYGHVTGLSSKTLTIPSVNNGTLTVQGTGALGGSGTFTANQAANATISISHDDTSTQASSNNSNGTVIQDVTLDTYGHVTGLGTYNLDGRYYTETESNTLFVNVSGDTMAGNLSMNSNNITDIDLLSLGQNTVGTTFGDGVSSAPDHMISQLVGDNDGWRLYGEAPSTNDVKMIFEIVDDLETGDTWIFRNKKTYSPYTARDEFKIAGDGKFYARGNGYVNTNQRVFADNYHPNADKWTTARTITLGGDLSGSVSIDGSANVTLSATVTNPGGITMSGGANDRLLTATSASAIQGEANLQYNGAYLKMLNGVDMLGYNASGGNFQLRSEHPRRYGMNSYETGVTALTTENRSDYVTGNSRAVTALVLGNTPFGTGTASSGKDIFNITRVNQAANGPSSGMGAFSKVLNLRGNGDLYLGHTSSVGAVYATKYYDKASTSYYLDPGSSGVALHINGIIDQDFSVSNLNSAWTAPGTSRDQGFIFGRFSSSASNKPSTNNNANWLLNIYSHSSGGTASYGIQLAGSDAGSGENALQLRNVSNGSFGSWRKVFHEGHPPTAAEVGAAASSHNHDGTYVKIGATHSLGSVTRFQSNNEIDTTSGSQSPLEIYQDNAGHDAFMTFHVSGDYAAYFGLDGASNDFVFGGWSRGAVKQRIFHDGYHPNADTLTTARTIAGTSFNGSANIDISYNNLTNKPTIPSGSDLVRVYTNQNYVASSSSTSNRGNFGTGLTVYEGYSSGTNRPHTYDTTLQVMSTASQGFELSIDWVSASSTPLKIRSLRDCCQGWNPWTTVWTENNFSQTNINNWNTAYGWGNHASAGYLTGSPTSITIGGIKLEDSSDRSGLLEINQKSTLGWSGIQIVDGNNRWSFMGNNSDVGIYDDYNGEWILLYNVNGSTELYHNGSRKFQTSSSGIDLTGGITSTGSWSYTNGSYGTQTIGYYYGSAQWYNTALSYYIGNVTGTSSSVNRLYVKGSIGVGSASASTTYGRIDASNDIIAYSSDKRLKENILPINGALGKISKLSGFTYNWNDKAKEEADFNTNERLVGVFAQDVKEVLPEAVKLAPFDNDGSDVSKSGEDYLTVQYEKIVPLLIEGMKEQQAQIEELTTILEQLTKQLNNGNNI